MAWRRRSWFAGLCLGLGVVASACAKDDDSDDKLADPTVRPPVENDEDDRRNDEGSLPRPATSSSSGGKNPGKDGGSKDPSGDGGSSSGGVSSSGGTEPECADPNDNANSMVDLAYPADYVEVSATDQATKEMRGTVGDYYDYDYFGFDVFRNASGTVFPFSGEQPFPANTEICMFMQCVDGEPTSFTCDAGEETVDFSGHTGCCSVSSAVSMYYATCNGQAGDDAWVFVRVTPNDENVCSVPYTVRASFTH